MSDERPNVSIEAFTGNRYKHISSENIEGLIDYMNYGFMKRWKLRRSATVFLLKRLNCFYQEYEFVEINTDKTVFWPGHTRCCRDYSFANGWQSKRFFFDGNKMVKVQKGNKKIVTVWEFGDNDLVMTVKVDNIVAKKFYERTHDSASGACVCLEKWCID